MNRIKLSGVVDFFHSKKSLMYRATHIRFDYKDDLKLFKSDDSMV